jgi:hypothetical protein
MKGVDSAIYHFAKIVQEMHTRVILYLIFATSFLMF